MTFHQNDFVRTCKVLGFVFIQETRSLAGLEICTRFENLVAFRDRSSSAGMRVEQLAYLDDWIACESRQKS